MREFIVTLRCGKRYTVKAERVKWECGYLALVTAPSSIGDVDPFAGVVALFQPGEVAVVVADDHLVSEEKGEPVDRHFVSDEPDPDSEIPF